METFAYKWFIFYYFILSGLFSVQGLIWMFNPNSISQSTKKYLDQKKAPSKAIRPIRYLFLFSIVSLILAFFPFSWLHFGYVLWTFVMIFISGKVLLNWETFSSLWKSNPDRLLRFFQRTGALFLMIGLSTFAILYFSI